VFRSLTFCFCLLLAAPTAFASHEAHPPTRVTILVDAFSRNPRLRKDWGFAAFIEYQGKRILFDTGNNAEIFAANARNLNVDLARLDFAVISHRHGDHTDGLRHLLKLNPRVKIFAPADEYFGGSTPQVFFHRSNPSLPTEMRYFDGQVPNEVPHGTPWPNANFVRVDTALEVMPGIVLVANVSPGPRFTETPELSLALSTAKGQLLLVGCSHPGIEQILSSIKAREKPVRLVMGGLHLVTTTDAEVDRLAIALRDEWKLGSVAPGHCTGEYAFATLSKVFGPDYTYAGVGSVVRVP